MNVTDHAIVVGVQRYPTLGGATLTAPDNDANAVAAWLESSTGGQLDPAHIHLIRSADYPDPFGAQGPAPIETDIVKAFEAIANEASPAQGGRVGRRFYFYVSGHGFGHVRGRGALFTANATSLNRSHLFVASYFDWIVNAGLFEQYVLWFDACSTRERLELPQPASLALRNSARAHEGRMMIAYAARFFLKAVENTIEGEPRGVFTHTLLEGLRGDAKDPSTGAVTTATLRNYLINNMRRHMSPVQVADPDVSNEPDFGTVDDFNLVPPSPAERAVLESIVFAPTSPNVRLSVQSGVAATEIFVVDGHGRLVARGLEELEVLLPAGDYTVRATLGRGEWQQAITLDADRDISIPLIGFATAIPLDGPYPTREAHDQARTHEEHVEAARDAALEAKTGPGRGASLMVMGRWWTAGPRPRSRLSKPLAGVELHHHGGPDRLNLGRGATEGYLDRDRWATRTLSVDPGLHTLRLTVGGQPAEMTVTALKGWQTRVFLLFEPTSGLEEVPTGKRLSDVSLQMWREGVTDDDEAMRLADAARIALADERSVMSPELLDMAKAKFHNPMMGLYALHLMLLLKQKEAQDSKTADSDSAKDVDRPARFSLSLFDETLRNTTHFFGKEHPDIRALHFAANQQLVSQPLVTPPMLWRSWAALVEASNVDARMLPVDLWERVAEQTVHRPLMIWMRRSAAAIRNRTKSRQVEEMLAQALQLQSIDAKTKASLSSPRTSAESLGRSLDLLPSASTRDRALTTLDPNRSPIDDVRKRTLSMEMGVPRSVIDRAI